MASHRRRVAVMGGSFDPITTAHITVIAELVNLGLADQVLVVPCGNRPDRSLVATFEERVRMCHIACDTVLPDSFPVEISSMDQSKDAFTPTVQLMRELRDKHGSDAADFLVVVGEDVLPSLDRWHLSDALRAENTFIVMPRPGFTLPATVREAHRSPRYIFVDEVAAQQGAAVATSNISSTEARRRLARRGRARDAGVVAVVPHAVFRYIEELGLYTREA